jgi:DNA polymerase elongation subunit (family B)
MAATILNKRIPYHDNLTLTRWYSADQGRERWRTLNYKLTQATATLLLIDALDIIGRAGEAARLSGVEFSQSFPGIRGSQYKVEGVLLRALQSLHSDERGQKKGRNNTSLPADLQGIAIDGGSSLSTESKSQTQSPWKMRRKLAVTESANARFGEDESEDFSLHDLAGRNYFFFSPSLTDANKQEALEVQALTLEPQSGHQIDPVVVCDFTALYPSLVIAYNLCYSTCFGKLDYLSTRREMRQQGRTTGKVGPIIYPESRTATVLLHHMKSLEESTGTVDDNPPKDRAYAAPNGTLFVSEAVLKGVLPQVLDEILSTRAMLKKAAKEYQRSVPNLSPSILRQLEARQLALKYVANVTYGECARLRTCGYYRALNHNMLLEYLQDTLRLPFRDDVPCQCWQIPLSSADVAR